MNRNSLFSALLSTIFAAGGGMDAAAAHPFATARRVESAAARFGVAPDASGGAATGWTFVSITNGIYDVETAQPADDADLCGFFRCFWDDGGLLVECVAHDDDVCVDACKPGDLSCRSWTDDCTELFLDGALARLTDSRADGGKHLAHGGEFVLTANGAAMSDYSSARRGYLPPSAAFAPDAAPRTNVWWTAEAFWNGDAKSGGYATRFYIPWAAMALSGVPERIGFTISFQDDDDGGERDHTLYWTGSHYLPFRNESAFGDIVFADAPASRAAAAPAAAAPATPPAAATFVLATDYAAADGVTDAADALQRCIDENPHRTIFFPDGEYLLSHPIATPADPARAVTLRLSDFAFLKASPDWAHTNAMVRLGARAPANNNRAPGSVYGLFGGTIDGAGRATGISIESGRETRVQNVAIKRCHIGIHVMRGANGGSADCDIRDIDMTGNNEPGSIGLLVEAHDNTFTNFRMVDFQTGVRIRGSGNFLTNIHPLLSRVSNDRFFDDTVGFDDNGDNNSYLRCYSDQFSSGWLFGLKSDNADLDGCFVYWYDSNPGKRHTAIRCETQFRALVDDLWAGFRDTKATNAVLLVGEPGGHGVIRDIRLREDLLNAQDDVFRDHFTGTCHR